MTKMVFPDFVVSGKMTPENIVQAKQLVGPTCAGCGKPCPDRVQTCDCPTQCVNMPDGTSAWKRQPHADTISASCHRLIGRFYEKPHSRPRWMTIEDVDLVKAALKNYAELHER